MPRKPQNIIKLRSRGRPMLMTLIHSLNPQNKPPDLISFDVFGDDSNLNALSPDTPGAHTPEPTTSSAPGGLPLDLFSSFASSGPSAAPAKARQDPMAFFNTPQPLQQQSSGFQQAPLGSYGVPSMQQPVQQQSGSSSMFAGLDFSNSSTAASGSSTPGNGFGAGISLPLTPSNMGGMQGNIGTRQPVGQPQQQTQPAAKKDPFADLANW